MTVYDVTVTARKAGCIVRPTLSSIASSFGSTRKTIWNLIYPVSLIRMSFCVLPRA